RRSDGTKYVFFCTFGSKRRLVRRCECEMLCPKPGTAPVTWQTAAMVILHYRDASASPKVTCRHTNPPVEQGGGGTQRKATFRLTYRWYAIRGLQTNGCRWLTLRRASGVHEATLWLLRADRVPWRPGSP